MKTLWNRFLTHVEIYSYYRVLRECSSILSEEQKTSIREQIVASRKKMLT